jgi:hypothetical protein
MTVDTTATATRRTRLVTLAQSAAVIFAVVTIAVSVTELGLVDLTGNSLWVVIPSVLLVSINLERRRRMREQPPVRHA